MRTDVGKISQTFRLNLSNVRTCDNINRTITITDDFYSIRVSEWEL